MKPLKINGTAQNFSPYETGVKGVHECDMLSS